MTKAISVTVGIIALVLIGAFWWWKSGERVKESAVFMNDAPVVSQNTVEEEASPTLTEDETALQDEIEQLEVAKEKEGETPSVPQITTPKPAAENATTVQATNRLMSSGYAVPKNPRKIDTVVLHSSYNSLGGDQYSVDKIVAIYKDYGVSAHYIIDRKGTVYRLAEDKNISYHAGASKMPDGRTNVNDFSIGIELVNTMDDEYTKAQYSAVNNLIGELKKAYPIKHVVGHSDIAPSRKTDPWNFDWKKLKE